MLPNAKKAARRVVDSQTANADTVIGVVLQRETFAVVFLSRGATIFFEKYMYVLRNLRKRISSLTKRTLALNGGECYY